MQEIQARITERGQITLPVEVRRRLGLKPKDKVSFVIDDDSIRVTRPAYTFESLKASVKPLRRPEDWKKVSREARDAKAQRTIDEMRGQ